MTVRIFKPSALALVASLFWGFATQLYAQTNTVVRLTAPGQLSGSTGVARFDFSPVGTDGRGICSASGVTFDNGTQAAIPIYPWTDLDQVFPGNAARSTSSAPHVLATASSFGGRGSTFLDVLFTAGKNEFGAYFGNDQGVGSIQSVKLTVFGSQGQTLGSVSAIPNGNTSVDQFIGVRSQTPFVRARIENVPSSFLSVAVDDVMFNVAGANSGVISTIDTGAVSFLPYAVAVQNGVVYVADEDTQSVWQIKPGSAPIVVAGTGDAGFNGDGIPAVQAQLNNPTGIALDATGALYIADSGNHAIRKVATPGVDGAMISTVAGIPTMFAVGNSSLLYGPRAAAVDKDGFIYIADRMNQQIRRADPATGALIVLAGVAGEPGTIDGPVSCSGTGCLPPPRFNSPLGIAVDDAKNVYVADEGSSRVRVISNGSVRSLPAGATSPTGLAATSDGSTLFVADYGNHRVRSIATADSDCATISLVAGTGQAGDSGDGGSSASAQLQTPVSLALDGGVLYVADRLSRKIRKIEFPVIN
jgi:sugar lactone lactonase YvrE